MCVCVCVCVSVLQRPAGTTRGQTREEGIVGQESKRSVDHRNYCVCLTICLCACLLVSLSQL